ncbi:S8 family serine peptidase [Kribbella sp. NPDC050281]|uniref:S8 family serine peptidase n=1 Tax=Kribbella sp. NPDC050281 TaxID=3155515 RepID=UPI0033D05ED5
MLTAVTLAGLLVAGPAAAAPPGAGPSRQVSMPDGGHIALDPDGAATRTDAQGNVLGRTTILIPDGTSAVGGDWAPTDEAVRATFAQQTAQPGQRVSAMSTGPKPVPAEVVGAARQATPKAAKTPPSALPANYGLTSSAQSFLNAGGTNAVGAFSTLQERFGQLPGAGQIITNVSIGDLTDQAMADAGDNYVRSHGPTTIVRDGQRYLDLPAMPLIPTYTAGPDGRLDPVGSTEGQDAQLGEVLLDFGVMAPLPHDKQRPEATGDGLTDLLGIAPGAQYRLVVPKQPTFDQIAVALLAAAGQTPRPDVITASLGFGTDTEGFPGRYLEDDPVIRNVVTTIVHQYHIVVTISSNDGTRLYTPTAVGPDGGSTPTDLVSHHEAATTIDDVAQSTTPTRVPDSGAIAVGGTTLDDIASEPSSHNPTFAATRTNGGTTFSSGFGTRLNVSAPSDGILVYEHTGGGSAQEVTPVLNGGTSASAPMVAAAAAVVLQASELTGHRLSPTDVRALLERTGRAVASPPQMDRKVTVGPQLDVTAAVNEVLEKGQEQPRIARLSVAHRVVTGGLGGSFLESSDPDRIDLQTGGTGEGLVGPITIGADVVGSTAGKTDYVLTVNGHEFHSSVPAVRLTPSELLGAAGLPVVSDQDRDVSVAFEVRNGEHVVASAAKTLTVGPTDGTYAEALAPVAPATVRADSAVTVHYDLTGVRNLSNPQLVVSTLGHWNPLTAPLFGTGFVAPLNDLSGDVVVPASAFAGGGGIYGIGIVQRSVTGSAGTPTYGEFTAIRVDGGTADRRPPAPTLGPRADHRLEIRRAAPRFSLRYDVRSVPGATGAAVEFSAPAPTLYNALNTFTNANGDSRDQNGVNAGSVAYQPLPARSGVASLNAVDLGLGGSVAYNVRVFGTDRSGGILGQASASSLLTVDDGLAPGDGRVTSFAAQPGGTSYAALRTPGGGESVLEYDTAAGTYGGTITTDPSPESGYQVLGADPQAHRVVLLHFSPTGSALETYDTTTKQRVGTAAMDGYTVRGGRVDPVRHRAAILALRNEDGADVVLPIALATGTPAPVIAADPPGAVRGGFKMIELDRQTGTVYLSRTSSSLICIGGGAGSAVSVDLDTSALRLSDSGSVCANGLALDEGADRLYQLSYRSVSLNIVGTTSMSVLAGETMTTAAPTIPVRQQQAAYLAIDSVHHLGLVAFRTPPVLSQFGRVGGVVTDSNATSQLAVIDLATGQQVSVVSGLNFVSSPFGGEYNSQTERAVQLDPSTRTGWVPSVDGRQLQQFRY